MSLPTDLPFFDVRRGGGKITDWHEARERSYDKQQDEKLNLLDPGYGRGVRAVARGLKATKALTYRERRDLGLCTVCLRLSKAARCGLCWERYNAMPCRQRLRKNKP